MGQWWFIKLQKEYTASNLIKQEDKLVNYMGRWNILMIMITTNLANKWKLIPMSSNSELTTI